MKSTLQTLGLVLLVAGCASRSPSPAPVNGAQVPASPPVARAETRAPAASAPAPKPSPLASEHRWLARWFEGTPVGIHAEADGTVQLTVPVEHSFDSASPAPKPALKAVLDKVGQSLKRQPSSRLSIVAPGRSGSARALAARQHLVAQGVPQRRVTAAAAATEADKVLMRLSLAPSPIGRLEDSAPAMARQPSH